jgi:CrcB protein
METLLLIGIGGFIGANLRYAVSVWAAERFGAAFPWGTLVINFTGSLLLAVFVGWLSSRPAIDPRLRLLVAVGFFGAYTTYSTFSVESVMLFQSGNWLGALQNIAGTTLVCILGALVGLTLGARL